MVQNVYNIEKLAQEGRKGLQFESRRVILTTAVKAKSVLERGEQSNEGRNPSQLSADYDYMRLR